MRRRPPRSTRTDTLSPYTTLFRSGRPVIKHKPGQYLTFWLEIPGHAPIKRNYSISDAPNGETYRITVKHEPQGVASGWMHEEVKPGTVLKVAQPAGGFFLAADRKSTRLNASH